MSLEEWERRFKPRRLEQSAPLTEPDRAVAVEAEEASLLKPFGGPRRPRGLPETDVEQQGTNRGLIGPTAS